jgi:hypothetical protein
VRIIAELFLLSQARPRQPLTLILNGSDKRKTPKELAEKLFIATSAPEGVIEKKTFTARLKASPDTNR